VFNLSRSAQAAELDLSKLKGHTPIELLGRSTFPPIGELPYLITLPGYGFFWFVLAGERDLPSVTSGIPEPMPEFMTLVTRHSWRDMLHPPARTLLEREVLPAFLTRQRWFAGKNERIAEVTVTDSCELPDSNEAYVLTQIDVALRSGTTQRYFLPLAITETPQVVGAGGGAISYMIAQVRRGPRLQGVYDAAAVRGFALNLLHALIKGEQRTCEGGHVAFKASPTLTGVQLPPDPEVRRLGAEQSNSSLLIGEQVVLKIYRRLVAGIHPEIEFGEFFNTVGYANTPALMGSATFVSKDGVSSGLAIVQSFVRNQGDGWSHALNFVQRMLDTSALGAEPGSPEVPDLDAYLAQIRVLGRRIAELHRALATSTGNPDFEPEPITADDIEQWRNDMRTEAENAFSRLQAALPQLAPAVKPEAETLLGRKDECVAAMGRLLDRPVNAVKIRIHGDLHLGQVLVAQNDWYVVDFEGEPAKDLASRRRKHAPLRDVAGMLRSFDYAAQSARQRAMVTAGSGQPAQAAQADAWRAAATAAFLEGYRQTASGSPGVPADMSEADRLLQVFLLEKACYELSYEAANRPDWIAIPIRGIGAVLDAVARTS
jgi:maltose alpha-D-glucosyltransferase/alpha-amylase